MTLISAISTIGSVSSSSSKSSLNKMNATPNTSSLYGNNQNAHLADVNILANILGLIGINVSAKVL